MKKILTLVTLLAAASVSFAQGSFNGNTYKMIRFLQSDGVTAANATFKAEYWYGTTASAINTEAASSLMAITGSGLKLGTYNPGTVTFSGPQAGDSVFVQVRAWSGSATDWATGSTAVGGYHVSSDPYQVTLVAATGTLNTLPIAQGSPAPVSLTFTANAIPEPSTIALGVIGAAALLFRRRK